MSETDVRAAETAEENENQVIALCHICGDLSAGLGPFSELHLCAKHLEIDVADARRRVDDVNGQLRPFRGAEVCGSLKDELQGVQQHRAAVLDALGRASESLDRWRDRANQLFAERELALRTCLDDCNDISDYCTEVAKAESSGDIAEASRLALSMQASLSDLHRDFNAARELQQRMRGADGGSRRDEACGCASTDLRDIQRLQRMIDNSLNGVTGAVSTGMNARPESRSVSTSVSDPWAQISVSHSVQLDDWVTWVAACNDAGGFFGDATGRVVPVEAVKKDASCSPVPQPCLILAFNMCEKKDHLVVMSMDGSVQLRCYCPIKWQKAICGLHCQDGRRLFVAQDDAITQVDISGHLVRVISPELHSGIWGIGGSARGVFASGGNQIAEFDPSTGELKYIVALTGLPDAMLSSLAVLDDCLLLRDRQHGSVHQVGIGTQQLVALHPTRCSGLTQFESPRDVAVDHRGRLFVCEFKTGRVRVLDPDDGALLRTLTGGDDEDSRLSSPCALAIVTEGPHQLQRLVVACSPPTMYGRRKLVVFNLC